MALDPDLQDLAQGKNFAALTTLRRDGSPSTHVMWFGIDDDHVRINTEIHRAKYKHMVRDPRVAVMVWDHADPYRYIEVTGKVVGEVRGDEARHDIDVLSQRYTGRDYATTVQSERVVMLITVDKLHKRL